jgi:hypothetical protein
MMEVGTGEAKEIALPLYKEIKHNQSLKQDNRGYNSLLKKLGLVELIVDGKNNIQLKIEQNLLTH